MKRYVVIAARIAVTREGKTTIYHEGNHVDLTEAEALRFRKIVLPAPTKPQTKRSDPSADLGKA